MRYRKKPVVIEAWQVPEDITKVIDMKEILKNQGCDIELKLGEESGLYIETLEGKMKASIGDYIIKGVKGEFYPCKPDIFEATYEPAQQDSENK